MQVFPMMEDEQITSTAKAWMKSVAETQFDPALDSLIQRDVLQEFKFIELC